ncbi:DUF3560 domain-containing protein [Bradyrhizobium sp. SZCCHNR1075]|uniref:DUF3560 domain-containing protein n=1 Tax=Bradyrhizobium sp. SZCCHNR1075 TaxID=3057362 RepID=UPI0028F0BAC8|nr:DUF3560 domain-containing protein [Bradyrhizobium sp. SZCCHNR1075]
MTTFTATYSPEDNKLRLYASTRLDEQTYAQVKAAGFVWAAKQDLFVAPTWTPERADLLTDLAGEIGDEDSTLVERAETRADRFEGYSDKRADEAEGARRSVDEIAERFSAGQPILIGHHSERRALKDKERIESGMRKAVKLWETSTYWKARAAGAVRHAKYKERPDVRARRIKTLEADKRKFERAKTSAADAIKIWTKLSDNGIMRRKDGSESTFLERAIYVAGRTNTTRYGAYSDLKDGKATPEQVQAETIESSTREIARAKRWIAHISLRIEYEKAMLDEAGASQLLAPKPKKELPPLLNYRAPGGTITTANMYSPRESITYPQIEMTKAEYAAINKDYKGARPSADKSHRFRTAMRQGRLVAVFLTDSKAHDLPKPEAPKASDEQPINPAVERAYQRAADTCATRVSDPSDSAFMAMKQTLRNGGIQVVAAPQLFPTPSELARRIVQLAGVMPGERVLEPSAGTGAILRHIFGAFTSADCGRVVAVEVNRKLAAALEDDRSRRVYANEDNFKIVCADFLECGAELGAFDRVVMNPPFENGADIKHILHAMRLLKGGGRLVAICANGPRQQATLRPLATEWHDLPPGTFAQAGTNVSTAIVAIDAPKF